MGSYQDPNFDPDRIMQDSSIGSDRILYSIGTFDSERFYRVIQHVQVRSYWTGLGLGLLPFRKSCQIPYGISTKVDTKYTN